MHKNSLLHKLGHRPLVFNRIYHMLDKRSLMASFNGLVLPHLDCADVVWGDQPGLTTQMKHSKWFEPRGISSLSSVIVQVSVVLKRTVGDSD